ncbi:MAG TPA: VWA domain-containing protein, partial [Pirellulaceae bacterium]
MGIRPVCRWFRLDPEGYGILLAGITALTGAGAASCLYVRWPELGIPALWRKASGTTASHPPAPAPENAANKTPTDDLQSPIDWARELRARGTSTRLGDALVQLIRRERGGPISGIIVLSDGNLNQGATADEAIAAAREARVPLHVVGLGSDRRPRNVRIVDVEAPARVFPGDSFRIQVFVQGFGWKGQTTRLELLEVADKETSEGATDKAPASETKVDEAQVTWATDGDVQSLAFELSPSRVGRRQYKVRIVPPGEDSDSRDNERVFPVVVVDRKQKVLLLASGPNRDYRFLAVQCFRDPEIEVDVCLQSSRIGSSQEADRVLSEFPTTWEAFAEYDCVVAFDPDWSKISDASLEL